MRIFLFPRAIREMRMQMEAMPVPWQAMLDATKRLEEAATIDMSDYPVGLFNTFYKEIEESFEIEFVEV